MRDRDSVDFHVEIVGNINGPPLVFMSGFPDNQRTAWHANVVQDLGITYKIILLAMPNYVDKKWLKAQEEENIFQYLTECLHCKLQSLGITMPATAKNTDSGVDFEGKLSLNDDSSSPSTDRFVLIAHGMGCYLALIYENYLHSIYSTSPIHKLILMDNGIKKIYLMSELFYIFFYEIFYASIFYIHIHFSSFLATLLLKVVLLAVELHRLLYRKESTVSILQYILLHTNSEMCFIYYRLCDARLSGKYQDTKFPHVPLLFMWGGSKRVMLHDDEFIWNMDSQNKVLPKETPHIHGRTYSFDPSQDTICTVFPQNSPADSTCCTAERRNDSFSCLSPDDQNQGQISRYRVFRDAHHYFTRKEPSKVIREVRSFLWDYTTVVTPTPNLS